jgi:hypothetical protein
MDLNKVSNNIFIAVYIGGVALFVVLMAKVTIDKRRGRTKLEASILAKLKASIAISAKDVNTMARSAGIARTSVSQVLSQLLLEANEQQAFASLQKLAADVEKTEPFEDLPPEVKPSLARLQELIDVSSQKSDVHLLSPIQRALGSYVEQKAELESSRRVQKWMNLISVIGFIVGLGVSILLGRVPTQRRWKPYLEKLSLHPACHRLWVPQRLASQPLHCKSNSQRVGANRPIALFVS